jgi:hypothetical protein
LWETKVETIEKNVEYMDLQNNIQTVTVQTNVPVSYDDYENNNIIESSSKDSRGSGWRNKIENEKRILIELSQQLGIPEDQWQSIILETLKNNVDDVNNVCDNDQTKGPKCNKKLMVFLDRYIKECYSNRKPKILLSDLDDRYVKDATGFPTISAMLCHIIIINIGDINNIVNKTVSKTLTWLEEWLIVLERLWGRCNILWRDVSMRYGLSERHLTTLFDNKIKEINVMRDTWGHYAAYDEDRDLRSNKWSGEFAEKRLVMWDNTSVPLCFMPLDAEAQRNTYSLYYGGNVGKGGVMLQPCGWMGTHELFMGAISDTKYMLRSGVFVHQHSFAQKRDPLSNHVTWLNMLDRGYRNLGSYALNHGHQKVVQPNFVKLDNRFNTYETLRSACVAAICAANERAVRNAKTSKYIGSGLRPNDNCVRLCNVWLSWGFQCNFQFRPVH